MHSGASAPRLLQAAPDSFALERMPNPMKCLGEAPLGSLPPGDSPFHASLQSPVFPVVHVSFEGSFRRGNYHSATSILLSTSKYYNTVMTDI
jgi:hypothetical protein